MTDPMDQQRAIVHAMTQGRVEWTREHRDALQALVNHELDPQFPDQIWRDLHQLLAVLVTMLPDYRKKAS